MMNGVKNMPMKPKRACAVPNCPELAAVGMYCEKHRKEENHWYNKYGRTDDEKKRYGAEWQRIRNRYIMKHPLCEKCRSEQRVAMAREVHHIVPIDHGGSHEDSNLMALCKPCHSRITAESGDRWSKKKVYTY